MKKEDGRGKHGKQGRKPTGLVRTKKLSARFTQEEKEIITLNAKKSGLSQSDYILRLCIGVQI